MLVKCVPKFWMFSFISTVNQGDDGPKEKKAGDTMGGGFSFGAAKPGSAGVKRALSTVNTHFYVGTEDGEIVYVDWMPQKDQDSGKIQSKKWIYFVYPFNIDVISTQYIYINFLAP